MVTKSKVVSVCMKIIEFFVLLLHTLLVQRKSKAKETILFYCFSVAKTIGL